MRVDAPGMAMDLPVRLEAQSRPVEQAEPVKQPKTKLAAEDFKRPEPIDVDKLKEAVETTNEAIRISNYHLEFKLHEESGRYQVKVVDSESQQVIREIPPENMLDFSARVKALLNHAVGVLVDELA